MGFLMHVTAEKQSSLNNVHILRVCMCELAGRTSDSDEQIFLLKA